MTLEEIQYVLPEERIAKFPATPRDGSKLLVYKEGQISHRKFEGLADELPERSLLVFNDTKVLAARLFFHKSTGAKIEVFLLEPAQNPVETELQSKESSTWKCLIGNNKKWGIGEGLHHELPSGTQILASKIGEGLVSFTWTGGESFSEIISDFGQIPLPPYLKRAADVADQKNYQTVYSKVEGAVAAPTAGLHFTEKVFNDLKTKAHQTAYLTLHVGAGTFQPIKTDEVTQHPMHAEVFVVSGALLTTLRDNLGKIIPVGTTAARTIESLYWLAVKISTGETNLTNLDQDFAPKHQDANLSGAEALDILVAYLKAKGLEQLRVSTAIYIYPGYKFRLCRGLITNFHQPGSTLILLISALIGPEWKTVYNAALEEHYRFLSFGDSSLLLP